MSLIKVKQEREFYSGFCLGRSRRFLLIQELRDFSLGGFMAFVLSESTKVLKEPANSVMTKGVSLLGLKPAQKASKYRHQSLADVLEFLTSSKKMTMIDFRRGNRIEHFFGILVSVQDEEVCGRFFSTDGHFMRGLDAFSIDSILRIQWDSKYERVMERLSKRGRK